MAWPSNRSVELVDSSCDTAREIACATNSYAQARSLPASLSSSWSVKDLRNSTGSCFSANVKTSLLWSNDRTCLRHSHRRLPCARTTGEVAAELNFSALIGLLVGTRASTRTYVAQCFAAQFPTPQYASLLEGFREPNAIVRGFHPAAGGLDGGAWHLGEIVGRECQRTFHRAGDLELAVSCALAKVTAMATESNTVLYT